MVARLKQITEFYHKHVGRHRPIKDSYLSGDDNLALQAYCYHWNSSITTIPSILTYILLTLN